MSEWESIEFRELADPGDYSFSIGPFGSAITVDNYVPEGVPVVRGVNLARGVFVDDEFVYITERKADELRRANLASGDLVFTHRGTIGQVSMIPRMAKFPRYVLSSSQVKARIDAGRASPEFYYYWFRSPEGQHSLLAHASTVGVPGIASPLATIRSLRVPFPSLPEQQAVVAVLGALDDKIAVNDRIAGACEELLRVQFDELSIDVYPDNSFEVFTSDLVEFNPKLPAPKGGEAVYLDMAAVPTDRATVHEWVRREPKHGTRVANGDTVMARITPCLENGKTAFIDFMDDNEVGIGSTEFIVMRARPGIPVQLPYFLARSPRFRNHAVQNMVGSSGRQRVGTMQLAGFPLSRPAGYKLKQFGEVASSMFSHMRLVTDESRALAELRDCLLPKLMSREIRVKDAERFVEGVT